LQRVSGQESSFSFQDLLAWAVPPGQRDDVRVVGHRLTTSLSLRGPHRSLNVRWKNKRSS